MIIENVEALKAWLTKTLSPICDADPAALAKYVVALVKKDKLESELREICMDQLDVFLQTRTRGFVDNLFETLKNKSYASSPTLQSTCLSSNHSGMGVQNTTNTQAAVPPKVDRKRRNEGPPPPPPAAEVVDEEDQRRKRSRSASPKSVRLSEDRRRRYEERRFSQQHRSREKSRSRSPAGRSRERARVSRETSRPVSREHSRSPVRGSFGGRSRSRSWSKSRSGSRSRSRSISKGRKDPDSRGSTPTQDSGNFNTCLNSSIPGPSVSSAITVVSHGSEGRYNWENSRGGGDTPPPGTVQPGVNRPRCRDYDEKGYCMRGDLCPYDHGLDPVVVEDVNLPNVLPFSHGHGPAPPPGGPGGFLPGGPRLPPPGHPQMSPVGPPRPALQRPPRPGPQRPPRPSRPSRPPRSVETFQQEGYNPEAPAITAPPRPPFWGGPRGSRPNPHPQFYNQPPRQRDLVSVPTIPDIPKPQEGDKAAVGVDTSVLSESGRTVIAPKRALEGDDNMMHQMVRGPQHQYHTRGQQHFFQHYGPSANKKVYDPNRTAIRKIGIKAINATLEVRKIPKDLNNITKLNEHFGKFGILTNIQVCYENDPEAALMTFANHIQANNAYRSSEPVFNNRFIKVFWHKGKFSDQQQPQDQQQQQSSMLVSTTSSTITTAAGAANITATATAPTPGVSEQNRIPAKARLGLPSPNQLHLDNTISKSGETTEKASIVYTSSVGHLTKTVFNSAAALKTKANAQSPLQSPTTTAAAKVAQTPTKLETTVKKQQDIKKVAIQKKVQLQKQKHELLANYIKQQKLMIKKLEEKNLPAENRGALMESLKDLTKTIEKFKSELAPKKKNTPAPVTRSKSQTQKEILDAELELISKQHNGEDTSDLRKRLLELTKEAISLGILSRGHGRGRGRGTFSRGRARRLSSGSRTIDHRPKQIHVSGFNTSEKIELLNHFSQFGDAQISEFDEAERRAVITFKSRKEAEKAVMNGGKYKDKALLLKWHIPTPSGAAETSVADEAAEEAISPVQVEEVDEDALLGADDEDEEDEESRSWRR